MDPKDKARMIATFVLLVICPPLGLLMLFTGRKKP
jgi:hypothetical protein